MLYNIYTAIKAQIDAVDTANTIKGVEWYNAQYEGTIANTPRVFIEFPDPLNFEQLSKDARRSELLVRLHVVTQAMAATDGAVPDTQAQAHETTALLVLGAIDGFTPLKTGAKLTTRLELTGWQHFHKHKGWMVTFVEFGCKKML
jgi:hypothetical protein